MEQELMASAAAAMGVPAAEVNLEAWVQRQQLESLASDLLDAVSSKNIALAPLLIIIDCLHQLEHQV